MIEKPGTQTIITKPAGGITPATIALTTVGGVLALVALGAAAIAVFHVALTTVTVAAYILAVVAFVVLWPSIMLALRAARTKVAEGVARALPLETLMVQRSDMEKLIQNKGQQLANARGYMQDFRRTIDESRGVLPDADIVRWEEELRSGEAALEQARQYHLTLQEDLREFDLVIKKARVDIRLAEARGNMAQALQMAQLSPTEQHTTEAALSEITRRAGRTAELLDAALLTQQNRVQRPAPGRQP